AEDHDQRHQEARATAGTLGRPPHTRHGRKHDSASGAGAPALASVGTEEPPGMFGRRRLPRRRCPWTGPAF
ncbi:MAG: hypothetical protein M3328_15550, partial [Chloroflexota bacterium]|nr:hypothetical protein [Chloroflexota bacterium]